MVQINVKVNYRGMSYLTNVITSNNTSKDEILRLASEQVRKQWKNNK
jgi:hypothetical protein